MKRKAGIVALLLAGPIHGQDPGGAGDVRLPYSRTIGPLPRGGDPAMELGLVDPGAPEDRPADPGPPLPRGERFARGTIKCSAALGVALGAHAVAPTVAPDIARWAWRAWLETYPRLWPWPGSP